MYDNKMASDEELYNMLDKAFKEDKANFKNPKALYLYFSTLVDLHNAGKKDLQEVFDVYDDVTEKIEEENQKLTDTIEQHRPQDQSARIMHLDRKSTASIPPRIRKSKAK